LAKVEKLDVKTTPPPPAMEKVLFAGGCFRCMEKPFEAQDEVLSVASGAAGNSWPSSTELEEKSS
jgi:peptide-methionine (S)-S-oxide reductase